MDGDTVVINAGEHKHMTGGGAWLLLFGTIVFGVIVAILVLDLVNGTLLGSTGTTTG